jgi:hypothetical protein
MTVKEACAKVLSDCLALRPGEVILIVRDLWETLQLHEAFAVAAQVAGAVPIVLSIPRAQSSAEVPSLVHVAIERADAILVCTPWIFPHDLRSQAVKAGARLLSLCGVTDDILERCGSVDYARLAEVTRRAASAFSRASALAIITSAGTDIHASIGGRRIVTVDGFATYPGMASSLPGGVVAVIPIPGLVEGRLVLDGSIEGLGLLTDPIELMVEAGRVIGIAGGDAARWLEAQWAVEPPGSRMVSKFGIGTNPFASLYWSFGRGRACGWLCTRGLRAEYTPGRGDHRGPPSGRLDAAPHSIAGRHRDSAGW